MHSVGRLRRKLYALATLSVVGLNAWSQQDPAFTHYWLIEPQFNPAAVGRSPQLSITAALQTHASGYEDAGNTMYAGADMAFQIGRTRHGVGVLFQNDEFGLFSNKRFTVQYAYHFKLWGGTLSVGAEVDMLNETINGSKADLNDANDPAIPTTDLSGSKFDASAGLFYSHKKWYVGVAMQHVTAPFYRWIQYKVKKSVIYYSTIYIIAL